MPADLIKKTDTNRLAFPKINQAIQDSYEAVTKSFSADQNSNTALVKAKNVQAQLNAVVKRESDSNAETAQMRVDLNNVEHETANARLLADFEQVEKKMNESAYYQGIEASRHRDSVSQTDYYMLKIPHKDEEGNILKLKRGFAKDVPNNGFTETAREFAKRNETTVTVNASIFNTTTYKLRGVQIYNGQILNQDVSQGRYILGITEDNTLRSYPPETPAQTVLNDGCPNALTAFIPLITNGTRVDSTVLNSYTVANEPHPRHVICQYENKDLLVFTTDGRFTNNPGMTCEDVIRLLLDEGVQHAHMLDGGGSTQLVYKGTMLNRAIDNSGYMEREVPDFLYIAKDVKYSRDRDIVSVNMDIGDLSKRVADVLLDVQNKTDLNLGYARLRGAEGYSSQGIESWDGENKNTKLFITREFLSLYDYNSDSTVFRARTDGTLSTKKGTLGTFFTAAPLITNANSLNESGLYWATPSIPGTPSDSSSYGILHFQFGNNSLQIAIPFADSMQSKRRTRNDGSWGSWVNL